MVVSDPTYAGEHVKSEGKILRVICVLKGPVKDITGDSAMIVIPQQQCGRKNDIFISISSNRHKICPKNFLVGIISSRQETEEGLAELDLAFKLLGYDEDKEKNNILFTFQSSQD